MDGYAERPLWDGGAPWTGATNQPPAPRRRFSTFLRRLRADIAHALPARLALPILAAACLSGALDLVALLLLLGLGIGVMGAQLASFALAALCGHGLGLRRAARGGAGALASKADLAARLAIVVLLALALRMGVLASATVLLDLPVLLAFLPALGATAMVSALGAVLFVFPDTLAPLSRAARWRLAALGLVAYSVVLRLMFLGVTELMPQEAYYWNYAQHLDIGYLDHPPMVAWLIWAGTELLGTNAFGVRLAAWLCWGITAFFSFQLADRLFGRSAAFISVLLVATLPFYFGTGLVMTPDAPLTACWAGTLYFLERALRGGKAAAWWGAGLCFGLGLLSKYTIALLGPAALLFMLLDPRARGWFKRPEPYLAALVAVLVFSPVIIWNLEHDLASFAFQSTRRVSGSFRFSLPELLLGVAGLLTPTVLAAALAALWLRERGVVGGPLSPAAGEGRGPYEHRRRWLFIGLFTLVPLSVFVGFSLFHMARLNWTGPLWLAVLPAVAAGLLAAPERLGSRQRHLQRAVAPTLAIALALYGAGLFALVAGLPGLQAVAPFPAVPVGWQDFGAQAAGLAEEVKGAAGEEPVLIGLDAYNIASQLAFYAAGPGASPAVSVGRGVLGQPALMYGYWYRPDAYGGRWAVLFAFSRRQIESPLLRFSFAELGEVKQREVRRNGQVQGSFYYRIGRLAAKPALSPAAFAAPMAPD